jgi:peptide/nickel transport system permease protein
MVARLVELAAAPIIRNRRRLPATLVVGGVLVLGLIAVAGLAQWIAPYPFDQMHVRDRFLSPNLHYLAGTDEYGRDVFSRLLIGSQLSLVLGATATLISMAVGVPLGPRTRTAWRERQTLRWRETDSNRRSLS